MIANITVYTWEKCFNRTQRKIGAYSFISQHTHLKGDANNNNLCHPYSSGHMCLDLSSPHDACQKRKIEGIERKTLTLVIKVKDRPFVEGSRGCHALIHFYAQSLSAKEHHITLPLVIATFIMQSVAFILHHHKFVQRTIFSYTKWSHTFRSNFYCLFAPMTTYLGILLNP